jgi:hypothetical protein
MTRGDGDTFCGTVISTVEDISAPFSTSFIELLSHAKKRYGHSLQDYL